MGCSSDAVLRSLLVARLRYTSDSVVVRVWLAEGTNQNIRPKTQNI
jgi:hypothetical protein